MNGLNTCADLNIILLGSYDFLIGMDWLDAHHVILDCHNKSFTFLDGEGQKNIVKGIPRPICIKEITTFSIKEMF